MKPKTLSRRPYLVRAIYDWISDSGFTPYIVVAATQPAVSVPLSHVKDGKITLNVSPSAVHQWLMDATSISFSARFGGVPFPISFPMAAVVAIYAQETGDGMVFGEPEVLSDADENTEPEVEAPPRRKSHLKIVK